MEEIDQAFENVQIALTHGGGQGWPQVFRVNSYHTVLNDEVSARFTKNFAKWMPNHKPIWTEVGVAKLGAPDMRVEIEVVAYDPQGVKTA
jgi:enamine deaminase RidA (YjgF/YER057c/UK114 family)